MQARTGRSTSRRSIRPAGRSRSSRWLTAGALVLGAGALTAGLASVSQAATPKPQVLILLDTSGSMEYEAGSSTGGGADFTVPACEAFTATTPATGATYAKSRLTIAKEVLTGTYVDYWCRTDERTGATGHTGLADLNYPIPHTIPCSDASTSPTCTAPTQKTDGLLDLRKDDFLFGLMTFDAIEGAGTGEAGGFSFGGATASGIDLGIKNSSWGNPNNPDAWDPASQTWTDGGRTIENNGQLIVPWTPTNSVSVDGWNQLLQREIQDLVGYWGTPISPMLMDVSDFVESDPRVGLPANVSNPSKGDPYADCRERVAILITDGRASQGEDAGGYPSTITALQKLQGSPSWADPQYETRVFVIGYYGAGSGSGEDPLQIYRDHLGDDHVYQADSSAALAKAMSKIFSKAMTGHHSRTPVVITNATQSNSQFAMQLRFSAGFRGDGDETTDNGTDARNLIGYLDARVIGCKDDGVSTTAHELGLLQPDLDGLGQQDEPSRKIRFVVGKKLNEVVKDDGHVKLDKLKDGSIQFADFLDIASDNGDAPDAYDVDDSGASTEPMVDMGSCGGMTGWSNICASSVNSAHEIHCNSDPDCIVSLSEAAAVWESFNATPDTSNQACSEVLTCSGGTCNYPSNGACASVADCYLQGNANGPSPDCDWTSAASGMGGTGGGDEAMVSLGTCQGVTGGPYFCEASLNTAFWTGSSVSCGVLDTASVLQPDNDKCLISLSEATSLTGMVCPEFGCDSTAYLCKNSGQSANGNACIQNSDCTYQAYMLFTSPCTPAPTGTGTGSVTPGGLGSFTDPLVRKTFAKRLLRFLAAKADPDSSVENPRAKPNTDGKYIRRLGGLSRSTPVIQEPAESGRYALESWNTYVENQQQDSKHHDIYSAGCRPTVLYAGSHDGLLHAFRVDLRGTDSPSCPGAMDPQWSGATLDFEDTALRKNFGRELWAIMPSELLKRAKALATGVAYLMDGPLVVKDVLLSRSAPTGASGSNTGEWQDWRSVLVATYGQGGRGFLALDVTTPGTIDDVKLLWEVSSNRVCNADKCHDFTESGWDFSDVGNTTGAPAFGTAFLGGDEVAVAILPGGDKPADAPADWTPTVYIVRVDTGKILHAFHPSGADMPFTGSASAYPNTPGVVTTRAFLGDAGGRLWRIKMVGQPNNWSMDAYDDFYGSGAAAGSRQPILGTAKIAPVGFGRIEVIVGLGQEGHTANGASQGAVLSYEDAGTASPLLLRWIQPLDAGEYLTGEPVVFGKKVHFSTAVEPDGSLCSSQTGRIWSLHYANHSGSDSVGVASTVDLSGGTHACTVPAAANDRYCRMDAVPFGVQMVQLPSCVGSSVDLNSGSTAAQGGMKLVANIADTSSNTGPGIQPPSPSTTSARTEVKASSTSEYNETLQSAAWGYVLY